MHSTIHPSEIPAEVCRALPVWVSRTAGTPPTATGNRSARSKSPGSTVADAAESCNFACYSNPGRFWRTGDSNNACRLPCSSGAPGMARRQPQAGETCKLGGGLGFLSETSINHGRDGDWSPSLLFQNHLPENRIVWCYGHEI